jgi:acetoin utilization deacetylase AcuC-like enzyme
LLLITSSRITDHLTPPGHPESVARGEVMQGVADRWKHAGGMVLDARAATRAELLRVHSADHVDAIEATAGKATMLDPDTFTSPETAEVAKFAAGAVLQSVEIAMDGVRPLPAASKGVRPLLKGVRPLQGHGRGAFALVRPPGHHAERDRAMGFCFYNNIAVAAAHALTLGAARVAVVDYDVHHGNGTQQIFYADPRVLFISTHQYPFYPGTGAATEVGEGDGRGCTINIPLEAGTTDGDYLQVFDTIVLPALREYGPDLVLVSAGFDAHERDPLGQMRLTTPGYRTLTTKLRDAAGELCEGRIVLVTEGGYDLPALGECLQDVVDVLAASAETGTQIVPERGSSPMRGPTGRGQRAVDAVRAAKTG